MRFIIVSYETISEDRKQHISILEVVFYEEHDYEAADCRAVGSLWQDAPACGSRLIHTITIALPFPFRNLIWRSPYEKHEIRHPSSPDRLGLIQQIR